MFGEVPENIFQEIILASQLLVEERLVRFAVKRHCAKCEQSLKALLTSWSRTRVCDALMNAPDVFVGD